MVRYLAVIIMCCISRAEYLLLMQCYEAVALQHLTAAGYCSIPFSAYLIPLVGYLIAVMFSAI